MSSNEVDPTKLSDGVAESASWMHAMHLARSSAVPMTLKAVIEMGVLEIIAKAGAGARLSAAEIAAQLSTANPSAPEALDRMLRFLASNSVLAWESAGEERRYGLTPWCRYLLKNEEGVSLAPLVLIIHDPVFLDSWQKLKYAVLEGVVPFTKAHGTTLFEYNSNDPRFSRVFSEAMSDHSTIILRKILDTYNGFDNLGVLVDVAGGLGSTLQMIVSKYPNIKGINFDLPHVIQEAPPIPGVEHVGGDMFDMVPHGDAIFMKFILHNWSDEDCLKILKNFWKALPDSGKVIAAESIIPEFPETTMEAQDVLYEDLCMLAYTDGGKERTWKEYESLAKEAGFSEYKLVCRASNLWVMEFHKSMHM